MNLTEARELLEWGVEQNPGPWREHSLGVSRAAGTIAAACGMDAGRAAVLGLLHDIGRYEGVRGLHHAVAGYQLLMERAFPEGARVCVTHSFLTGDVRHFGGGAMDVSDEELRLIETVLARPFDDYDRLIQLCDALTWGEGVCLMERRLVEAFLRHGVFEGMVEKWKKWFELKAYFESKIGGGLYDLFPECVEYTFHRP